MLACPSRMGPILRYSKDKETSILHYLMLNCETQIVVLGGLKDIVLPKEIQADINAHTHAQGGAGKKKSTQRILKL